MGVHGVGKERGLRLNAVGVGGYYGVDFAFGQALQGGNDVGGGRNEAGEAFQVEAGVGGGENVLA